MEKKVVFVDWGGTLSDSMYWEDWMNGSEEEKEMYSKINEYLFRDRKNLVEEWMLGKYSAEDICHFLSDNIGADYKLLFNQLEKSCRESKLVSEEVSGLIKEIKGRGIKVVIATDNMDVFSRFIVPDLKLDKLFDDILDSCKLGVLKKTFDGKDLIFFKEYLNNNSLNYSDCVLIDDGNDTEGSLQKAGLDLMQISKDRDIIYYLKQIIDSILISQ